MIVVNVLIKFVSLWLFFSISMNEIPTAKKPLIDQEEYGREITVQHNFEISVEIMIFRHVASRASKEGGCPPHIFGNKIIFKIDI